jgi:L-lactate dehydrogenase complex protein LldG
LSNISSREKILQAINSAKPGHVATAEMQVFSAARSADCISDFISTVQSIGGRITRVKNMDLPRQDLIQSKESGKRVENRVVGLAEIDSSIENSKDAVSLADIEKVFVKTTMGVAENGAIWLSEADMGSRLFPFICQHLVVLLEEKDILSTLHDAYEKISGIHSGFHVFIAGPSKTADIEQSLVIGAHGPRSLLIYLIGNYS